jgi:predicted SAM-dependent methyltransferase
VKLLNVGCGRCYHSAWTNIDLVAATPEVRAYDLRRGLPYDDNSFDGVYHSHVLEHLTPDAAESMLRECARVLKPGGVLRVVVPDLEGIAREYLRTLDAASEQPSPTTLAKHRWMTLELIDQMTRQRTGGLMGQTIRESSRKYGDTPQEFIRGRLGYELQGNAKVKNRKTIGMRLSRLFASARKQAALAAVTLIDGSTGRDAYREGRFRQSGELHRWMYDRVSLSNLLKEIGLNHPRVCQADESRIDRFDSYELDRDGQRIRKPDSLFMEAVKTVQAAALPEVVSSSNAA